MLPVFSCARNDAQRVRPFASRVGRGIRNLVLGLAALCPLTAGASPSDCIGSSPDGKATCTAPVLSGYIYTLCNVSQLYIAIGLQNRCKWEVLGEPTYIDPDVGIVGSVIETTDPEKLNELIACMGGANPPVWASLGEPVGTYWCPVAPVRYKYGVEVVGASEGITSWYSGLEVSRVRTATCPRDSAPVGDTDYPDYCIKVPKCDCDQDSGMGVANGDQGLSETDISPSSDSPLEFSRSYSSDDYYRPMNAAAPTDSVWSNDSQYNPPWALMPGFGDYWRNTYSGTVMTENASGAAIPQARGVGKSSNSRAMAMADGSTSVSATVLRPGGVNKHFALDGSSVLNENGSGDTLTAIKDGAGNQTGWMYKSSDGLETYQLNGQMVAKQTSRGRTVTLTRYPAGDPLAGLLKQATDDAGRTLTFGYNSLYQLTSVTDDSQNSIAYAYNGPMLSSVTYPGNVTRQYLYNENPNGASGDIFSLTGVVDENGKRYKTLGYAGPTTNASTQSAGGVGSLTRSVVDGSHVAMTDAMGATRTYGTQVVAGVNRITSVTQPAGSGSAASVRTNEFDAAGNLASVVDFNGNRSCYVSDPVRNVETLRIEGLDAAQSCATLEAAGASLPAGSRKITTSWHPQWRLQARVAEPFRITTYVYNGQPDPTAGAAVATCAPDTARLLDSTPIAVLCKKVEQATTDADGSTGFGATAQSGVTPRVWSWTYNSMGQPMTATDPRQNVTTYTYYPSTAFTGTGITASGHTMGDLQSVKDALGHVTNYASYNRHGQPLQVTDPNNVTTTRSYDLRWRLSTIAVGTDQTSFTYYDTSLPRTVTMPSGLVLTYVYDDAHRLTQVSDSVGNSITYTLDDAGNRIGEQVKDPGGVLAQNVSRSYDLLGRLQSATGSAQ